MNKYSPSSRAWIRTPLLVSLAALGWTAALPAQTILGSMSDYAVMAGSTVTNTGTTTVIGDLGAAGFAGGGSFVLTGAQISPLTAQNQADFTRAFTGLGALTPTSNLTGLVLGTSAGATTLSPGIYHFDSTAQLTGTLVLDAQFQSNAVWVFQIGSTLTTAANAVVMFANLAPNSTVNDGLFWRVGTTTTFGAGTVFEGNVLGGTTFDFGTGVTINDGRALTGTDAMTLDSAYVNFIAADSGYSGGLAFTGAGSSISAVPEPATYSLLMGGSALAMLALRRRRPHAVASAPIRPESTRCSR
jgi:hypothetical protein